MSNVKYCGGDVMDAMKKIEMISNKNNGIITTKAAIESGISRATLSNICKKGKIVRIANGQYILKNEIHDELLSIINRSEQIIFSHETALFLHGLSDRTPFEHSITAPSDKVPSPQIRETCKVYYIKPELFDLGKTELKTPHGNKVASYDVERTICDLARSRNRIDTETFLNALKQYAISSKKDLNKLYTYANQLRVSNVLRKYLEVLL